MTLASTFWQFWNYELLHNPVWKWGSLLGVLLTTFVVGKMLSYLLAAHARRMEEHERLGLLRVILSSTTGPMTMIVFGGGLYLAQAFLLLDWDPEAGKAIAAGAIRTFWINACRAVVALGVAWFIFRLVDVLEHLLLRWTSRTDTKLDDQLVPMVRKTLRVFIVIVAGLFIAQNIFNMEIGPLMAGLGVGGLAFALAAKDSLANLFGSVVIFTDRPFTMGERIKVRNHDGVVEGVGFRSTRIRTLDGNVVTLPNSLVANEPIENIGRRPAIKRVLNVTVTYDTSPDKLQRGVQILHDLFDARMRHFPADLPPRVYFSDFNADSLNIVCYCWFTPPDWWEYLEFCHEFNMELLRRFNEEGIEFAFPTQTLYVKPDAELAVRMAAQDKT